MCLVVGYKDQIPSIELRVGDLTEEARRQEPKCQVPQEESLMNSEVGITKTCLLSSSA